MEKCAHEHLTTTISRINTVQLTEDQRSWVGWKIKVIANAHPLHAAGFRITVAFCSDSWGPINFWPNSWLRSRSTTLLFTTTYYDSLLICSLILRNCFNQVRRCMKWMDWQSTAGYLNSPTYSHLQAFSEQPIQQLTCFWKMRGNQRTQSLSFVLILSTTTRQLLPHSSRTTGSLLNLGYSLRSFTCPYHVRLCFLLPPQNMSVG